MRRSIQPTNDSGCPASPAERSFGSSTSADVVPLLPLRAECEPPVVRSPVSRGRPAGRVGDRSAPPFNIDLPLIPLFDPLNCAPPPAPPPAPPVDVMDDLSVEEDGSDATTTTRPADRPDNTEDARIPLPVRAGTGDDGVDDEEDAVPGEVCLRSKHRAWRNWSKFRCGFVVRPSSAEAGPSCSGTFVKCHLAASANTISHSARRCCDGEGAAAPPMPPPLLPPLLPPPPCPTLCPALCPAPFPAPCPRVWPRLRGWGRNAVSRQKNTQLVWSMRPLFRGPPTRE